MAARTAKQKAAQLKAAKASAAKRRGHHKPGAKSFQKSTGNNSFGVRRANRKAAAKKQFRSGTLVTHHSNPKTGRVHTRQFAVYDSKHNQRKRLKSTAYGAAIGSFAGPVGTVVGAHIGARRGALKYGQTVKPLGTKRKSAAKRPIKRR